MNEIVEKMNQLKQYGVKQFGIEDKFRGELIKPVEPVEQEVKNKKKYDM